MLTELDFLNRRSESSPASKYWKALLLPLNLRRGKEARA